jgi:Fic family protein
MDAWNHYQSFGKKEGRKWPNCDVQNSSSTPSPASSSPKASTPAQPARIYTHDCIYEKQQPISDSKAFSADEDIVDKYEKITKKYPVIFNEVNGNRVCSVFYFSLADRVVHRGDFTENQLSTLKAYKFQRLEDCLVLLQMVHEVDLRAQDADLEENEVHVRSNVTGIEIRTIEESLFLGKSQSIDFFYSFEKLRNKYLTISLKHPLCTDTVVEMDKKGRFVFVRMQYTSEFLREEFSEFKGKSDLKSLRSLQAITVDEKLHRAIASCADSIEIDACLKQGTGQCIESFLTNRPFSARYQDALKVRQYYKDAETKYTAAKTASSIKEYELFLKNFGYSVHKDEVKQLLVAEACRYYSKEVGRSDSLLACFQKYIVPNQAESWIEQYDKSLKASIENTLIAENKSSTIEQFAMHWKKVVSFEQSVKFKMNSYRSSFREALSNLYFEQFKRINSASSQDSLVASFLASFESYEPWADGKDDSEDFINHIFSTAKNKNGAVNLYNSAYLVNYLTANVPGFSKEYTYKGATNVLKKISEKAAMVFNANQLINNVTTHDAGELEFQLNFTSYPNYNLISFYHKGSLILEKHMLDGKLNYAYEFENGVNISLKALNDLIKSADKALTENKLEESQALLKKAQNSFPADLAENIQLGIISKKCNNALEKDRFEKEKIAAEEKKKQDEIAEKERKQNEEADARRRAENEKRQNASKVSEFTPKTLRDCANYESFVNWITWWEKSYFSELQEVDALKNQSNKFARKIYLAEKYFKLNDGYHEGPTRTWIRTIAQTKDLSEDEIDSLLALFKAASDRVSEAD